MNIPSRHHRSPRRRAQRTRAIGTVESLSPPGERIDVRSTGNGITVTAGKLGVVPIGHDINNIHRSHHGASWQHLKPLEHITADRYMPQLRGRSREGGREPYRSYTCTKCWDRASRRYAEKMPRSFRENHPADP